jgi:hypothetical protein
MPPAFEAGEKFFQIQTARRAAQRVPLEHQPPLRAGKTGTPSVRLQICFWRFHGTEVSAALLMMGCFVELNRPRCVNNFSVGPVDFVISPDSNQGVKLNEPVLAGFSATQ